MVKVEVTKDGTTRVWEVSDQAAHDQGLLVEDTNDLMVYLRANDKGLDSMGPIPSQVYDAIVLVLDDVRPRIDMVLADSEDTDMEVSVIKA